MHKLEILENKALYKIIGVPISIRTVDLHLESNVQPIKVKWEISIAF